MVWTAAATSSSIAILMILLSFGRPGEISEFDRLDPLKRYQSHEEMLELLESIESEYPHICQLYQIGKSVLGRDLIAVRLTLEGDDEDNLKPMVKYIGNMHGDEAVSRQMMLQLIVYLTREAEHRANVRNLLRSTEIHILPTMNPDGFNVSREGVCQGFYGGGAMPTGRYNARRVDLNRNFPSGSRLGKHEPETLAVVNWTLENPFVLSANFHGGAVVVSYLFDHSASGADVYSRSPDEELVRLLAAVYALNHKRMSKGFRCRPSDPRTITNGAGWYAIDGSLQDFTYIYSNCIDMTVEMSCCKHPPSNGLPDFWAENKMPLLKLIAAAHMGVKGYVVDAETGEPIKKAKIRVKGNAKMTKSDNLGRYWRLLIPERTYTLEFSANGYRKSVFDDVYVPLDTVLRLDVPLQRKH